MKGFKKKFRLLPSQLKHPITLEISPKEYECYIDPDQDSHLEVPILIHLEAEQIGEYDYKIYGQFEGMLISRCNRCLEDAPIGKFSPFQHLFKYSEYHSGDSGEDDLTYYNTVDLDLFDLCRDELLLNIPDYLLCCNHCLGLCPICGGNLNKITCNHS